MSLGSVTARNISLRACYGASHSSLWPNTLFLALYNGDPASTGTELGTSTGVIRLAVNNDGTTYPSASAGTITNAIVLAFAAFNATDSTTLTHWAYLDAATAGNVLDCGPIVDVDGVTPLTLGPFGAGDQVIFGANTLVVVAT